MDELLNVVFGSVALYCVVMGYVEIKKWRGRRPTPNKKGVGR